VSRAHLALILAAAAPLAACPKTGDPDVPPRVITRAATPAPTPGADPVESKRIAKLYRITVLETERPQTPEVFAPWLSDADASIREAAVLAVGRAGEAQAWAGGDAAPFVAMLFAQTKDPSADVRGAIAAAVGLVGVAASGKIDAALAAEVNEEVRGRWVRAAGRVAPITPKPPKPQPSPKGEGGGPGAKPLETVFGDEMPAAPVTSVPEIALLGKALDDDALAAAAGWALGVYGIRSERGGGISALPADVVFALKKRFHATAAQNREPFAYAMWRLHAPGTGAEMRLGLNDQSPLVRGWCARGLAGLPGTHARREVSRLLRDSSSEVRIEASRAIAKLEDADATAAVELVDLLERSDPPRSTEQPLAIEDPHSAVAAAEALGELGFRATAEPLRARLASDDPYLFGAAAVAYAKCAGTATLQDFSELAEEHGERLGKEGEWRFRRSIAEALAYVKHPKAPNFVAPVDHATPAYAISPEVPEAARALIVILLADPDARVSVVALDSYGELAGVDASRRMIAVLASSSDLAMLGTAADRLSGLEAPPSEAGPALVAALARVTAADPENASILVEAAAKLGGEAALPVLHAAAVSRANGLMLAASKALRAKGQAVSIRFFAPLGIPDEAAFLEAADWTRMTIRTKRGEIRLQLFPEIAPVTVWQIGTLARKGYFREGAFHRVVPAFVAQGGDPRGDGFGGPDGKSGAAISIPCELSDLPYATGTLGMALSGRDTGGSQFFIALTPQPHLESNYTVFGRVLRGDVELLQIGDEIIDVTVP